MEDALLCAARKLLRCGASLEAGLEKTLLKSDALSADASRAVADTLAKLVQDVAGAPVLLGAFLSDAKAMRCLVEVLHEMLVRLEPEKLRTDAEVQSAEGALRRLCERHGLPPACADVYVSLLREIAEVFRRLDLALRPPLVKKAANADALRTRVRHFFRDARADLLCYSFNSLKLAVCLRAMTEGAISVSRAKKRELHDILAQVKTQARTMAAVNELHHDNVLFAAQISRPRGRPERHASVRALGK